MALVFTIAGLRDQLSLYGEALAAESYTTARAYLRKARAIRMGLPDEINAEKDGTKLPNIQWFNAEEKVLTDAIATASASDRRRLIRTRIGFPGGRGRGC